MRTTSMVCAAAALALALALAPGCGSFRRQLPPDYLYMQRVHRQWPEDVRRRGVRVLPVRMDAAQRAEVARAVEAWAPAAHVVPLVLVDSPPADVTVSWSGRAVQGWATYEPHHGDGGARADWIDSVHVVVVSGGAGVKAHELGHALGLTGHSDGPDLMAPGAPAAAPTRRDIRTLEREYAEIDIGRERAR